MMTKFLMSSILGLLSFLPAFVTPAMAGGSLPPLQVVERLDLHSYLGKWYEIASIRKSFQKNCVGTTAVYSLRANGDIDVLNECRKFTLDGKLDRAHGKAWIPNEKEPAKLFVRFFWPFRGKYWVIQLGANYEYAVVGHPSRNYLWILSRTPKMETRQYDEIMSRLAADGYDLSRIEPTLQPEHPEALE